MKKIGKIVISWLVLFLINGCGQIASQLETTTVPHRTNTSSTIALEATASPTKSVESTPVVAPSTTSTSLSIPTFTPRLIVTDDPGLNSNQPQTPVITSGLPSNREAEFRQVAYVVKFDTPKPSSEIRIINLIDGRQQTLIHLEHQAMMVKQSPDGQFVAWIAQEFNPYRRSIWLMGPNQQMKQITPWSESLGRFQWSPDNQHLYIEEYDPEKGPLTEVYALSIEKQERVSVWFDRFPFETIASFQIAPNGQHVAYVFWEKSQLIVENEAGQQWEVQDLYDVGAPWMEWSPDSQWLAYVDALNNESEQNAIFITRPTGEERRQLISRPNRPGYLTWSSSSHFLGFFIADTMDSCYINIQMENAQPNCLERQVWSGYSPVWLSDDEWLLSTSSLGSEWDIYRVKLSEEIYTNMTRSGLLASDLTLWKPTQ